MKLDFDPQAFKPKSGQQHPKSQPLQPRSSIHLDSVTIQQPRIVHHTTIEQLQLFNRISIPIRSQPTAETTSIIHHLASSTEQLQPFNHPFQYSSHALPQELRTPKAPNSSIESKSPNLTPNLSNPSRTPIQCKVRSQTPQPRFEIKSTMLHSS
ncbi:hypothetical protein Droror1_Dr00019121 [Drosera rotundifolia]